MHKEKFSDLLKQIKKNIEDDREQLKKLYDKATFATKPNDGDDGDVKLLINLKGIVGISEALSKQNSQLLELAKFLHKEEEKRKSIEDNKSVNVDGIFDKIENEKTTN